MNYKQIEQALFYAISLDFSKEPGMIPLLGDDIKGFNEHIFAEAKIIQDWPDGIVFFYEGNRIDDYWKPRLGWNLVSERVTNIFHQNQIQGAQLLPVNVVHKPTGKSYPYWEINVYQTVVGLRRKFVEKYDIFKIKRAMKLALPEIYISNRLRQHLEQAEATSGFGFRPISAWILDKES